MHLLVFSQETSYETSERWLNQKSHFSNTGKIFKQEFSDGS